jgi:hypothetical protein
VVRTTAPPAQPALDLIGGTFRGRAEEEPVSNLGGRPQFLPEYNPGSWSQPRQAAQQTTQQQFMMPPSQDRWQPAIPPMPPTVILGAPEPEPPSTAALGRPMPIPIGGPLPVGYPR